MKIEHYIDIKPLSVNRAWQGRRFKTPEYDTFIEEMLYTMPKKDMLDGFVSLDLTFCMKSLLRGDLDNLLKPVIDCIVKKGWIKDDRYVASIFATKIKGTKEGFMIKIVEL